jgi:clan AA aspartic protease (TIGR02281 family)
VRRGIIAVVLLLISAGSLLSPTPSPAEIYQYEDDGGTVHFVDDPGRIPKKYQKRRKVREGVGDDSSGNVSRVAIRGNRVLVPVTLGYRGREVTADFVLDTGASTCTISPALADRLGINPADGGRAIARGVGGGVYLVGTTRLDYIAAGPNRKYDLDVSVIESTQADGLLGMNFLRELRYHVDFQNSTIRWGD